MWVDNAEKDHAAFVSELEARGVEVVELHDVLAQTMAVPGAKDWLLERKISLNQVGYGLVDETRSFLRTLDDGQVRGAADRRDGHQRPPRRLPVRLRRAGPRVHRGAGLPHAAAAQHALHPRHHVLALRRPDHEPALLAGPPRRDAALQGDLRVPPRLRRVEGVVGRPRARLGARHDRGRGRDADRQRHGPGRDERADVTPGHHPGRAGALRAGSRRARGRRRDAQAARRDAPRHGVHLRRPRRRHLLPGHRGRHPLVLPAPRGQRARDRGHRRGRPGVRRRRRRVAWASPSSGRWRRVATSTRPSASSGTAATTPSRWSRGWCSPTIATRTPTRCCATPASR